MRSDDSAILREVQKNTGVAMKAIDTISEYVHDNDFTCSLYDQNRRYQALRDKAVTKLIDNHEEVYKDSSPKLSMVSTAIHMNTLFNSSSSHLAELLIRGSNTGITDMWKAMNKHEAATSESLEIANELVDFEQDCISELRKYL